MKRTTTLLPRLLLIGAAFLSSIHAQAAMPTVSTAEMPLYPPLARAAHIAGTVVLRVTTDGKNVADVHVVNGPPMLAKAAQENIKTWRFVEHSPTSFLTMFSFTLSTECDPQNENGSVALSLPTEVRITAPPRTAECDANFGLDLSEPLKIFLTSCEADSVKLPCEKVSIVLVDGDLKATPRLIQENGKVFFVVPTALRKAKTFSVSVQTPMGSFSLDGVHSDFLEGRWRIVIDHKPFQEENRYLSKGSDCIGFIHFQWSEPERLISAPCEKK